MRNAYQVAADQLDPPEPEQVTMSDDAREMAGELGEFVRHAWHVLEPGTPYLHNWHIDLIAEYLQAFYARDVRRIIFNIPPRYMKSSLVTVLGPVWDWIFRPTDRFLFASYAQSLAYKHSVDRRTLIRSAWFQEHYGHVFSLASDQDEKRKFTNDRRGHMIATSMSGAATGEGGDFVIIDDPQDPKRAVSDTVREAINGYFDTTFMQRFDDPKRGGVAIVMQRLHTRDLTGHVLAKEVEDDDGLKWTHIKIPAEAPVKTVIDFPISDRKVKREGGDILWSEREGQRELKQKRIDLGSRGYAGQYQQEPTDEEGGIFKRHWWRFWKPADVDLPVVRIDLGNGTYGEFTAEDLPVLSYVIQSWDMAFKDTKSSDWVVGGIIGAYGANRYVLDVTRDRRSFTATIAEFEAFTALHPKATLKVVEEKANGAAVIDMLKSKIGGIVAENPTESKVARAWAVQPLVEAGNVYLPHPAIAPWVHDFIEEHADFPNGANDDQVDMLTQGLRRLMTHGKARVASTRGRSLSGGGLRS